MENEKQFTIVISTPSLRRRISAERAGIAVIVIEIGPALCCVLQVVRGCDDGNSAGHSLRGGILLRGFTGSRGNCIIRAFHIVPFAFEFGSLSVLCLKKKGR